VDVIYIGGSGRSGSTLLDRVLGQVPGVISAGEIRDIWRAGVGENRLCGCGVPFADCPFWTRVGDEAFGGWSRVDAAEASRLFTSIGLRKAMAPGRPSGVSRRAQLMRDLYRGIAVASDADVLVDSSKSPSYGAFLAAALPLRMTIVQLIRDSRGVAHSWSKVVKRPDTPGRDVEMLRLSPGSVALRWILHNGTLEQMARRIPTVRVGYERVVADMRTEVRRILEAAGRPIDDGALAFIRDGQVELKPNHTVMGNPMRLETGHVQLRLDEAWRTDMRVMDRATVTALTWPLLLRYGYRL
jgi:hypothetical protein